MTSSVTYPPVLDVCCGPRSMWFDKSDSRGLYVDIRRETHCFRGSTYRIEPDILADFTYLPLPDNTFALVVMDPPHIVRERDTGAKMTKIYGRLHGDWREMLRTGFRECFRVLRPQGTLIFKWNECNVPIREALSLTPMAPLFGHKSGKQMHTHWIAFLKP